MSGVGLVSVLGGLLYRNEWSSISGILSNANNQTIQVDSSNGNEVKKMKAVRYGLNGSYDVDCVFYDPNYQTPIDAEDVVYNQTIYWVTNENGITHHHQGTLKLDAVASNKSMS